MRGVSKDVPCGCVLLAYAGLFFPDGQARTIEFQIDHWENKSWGLHDVDRWMTWGTVAISSDGSRSNAFKFDQRKYYFIPQGRAKARSLYLRPENTGSWIDDERRIVHPVKCSCAWTPDEPRNNDPDCFQTANEHLRGKRAGYGTVAGISVVRYRLSDESKTEEIALAPLFGCELMDDQRTVYNDIGLPTSYYHFIVTAYVPGQPNPLLLMLPQGYQIEEVRK